jgi:flagellar assembly factor FliW
LPTRKAVPSEDPSLAFLVVEPTHFVHEYAPVLSDEAASSLELDESTPQLVYTIATIPNGKPDEMTINLAGPIVINGLTRSARQLVIEDPNYSIKHRVFGKTTDTLAA